MEELRILSIIRCMFAVCRIQEYTKSPEKVCWKHSSSSSELCNQVHAADFVCVWIQEVDVSHNGSSGYVPPLVILHLGCWNLEKMTGRLYSR